MNTLKQKISQVTAIILLFITGLNALAAGYSFITDLSGAGLGMTVDYLKHSPFNNYLIPGIILFSVIGVMSIAIAIATIQKIKHYPLLISIQGIILTGWIVIQVLMVKDMNVLHYIIFGIGFLLIIAGCMLKQKQ